MLFHDDIHIHEYTDETSLSHLNSPYFICSLFGSDFGGGSSFTYWMKEHMDDYIHAHYILWEQNHETWDPHLFHWGRFDKILDACVYGPHNDLLSQMYKHFNDSLMRYLLDVNLYNVGMYFHDLYFVLIMFGRVQYKKWDPGISWLQFCRKQAIWEIESPLEMVIVIRVVQQQEWWIISEIFLKY